MLLFTFYLQICIISLYTANSIKNPINAKFTKVWGPGLQPHKIVMPARYFFIQAIDNDNKSVSSDLGDSVFNVVFDGVILNTNEHCLIWTNILNRKDGSYIVRYKIREPCVDLKIIVKYQNQHVGASPYETNDTVYPEDCDCPFEKRSTFLDIWECGDVPKQIVRDLKPFKSIDWEEIRDKLIKKYHKPESVSFCHYVIKDNAIYHKCYGKWVGFKTFMNSILLSLSRKVKLPDVEFFVNLGDWPLVKKNNEKFPMLAWCGSTDTYDIIMPTYDITESSLEIMGRVQLDMLSVQGNVKSSWDRRIPKAFWRGRDSNQYRLDLIEISRNHPDLFNVSLTNFFFYRDKEDIYGPKSELVSFFRFFDYKYQLALDGTVAAYRFPYLLGGGSLVIKQDSKYSEHFYNELIPNTHYIPMKRDLSDMVEKIKWALENDKEAKQIARNGQIFANANLLPQHIYCYYTHLLQEFSQLIKSKVQIFEDMEKVEQIEQSSICNCKINAKDEL